VPIRLMRFWFKTEPGLGYGVTAFSRRDAESLLHSFGLPREGETVVQLIENIEVSELDANHILPNSGPVEVRGVWYPLLNL
jgi:hypothetical protein